MNLEEDLMILIFNHFRLPGYRLRWTLEDEAGRVGDGHMKNRITWSCWRRTRRATASQGQSRGSVSQEGNRRDCMPVFRTQGAKTRIIGKAIWRTCWGGAAAGDICNTDSGGDRLEMAGVAVNNVWWKWDFHGGGVKQTVWRGSFRRLGVTKQQET